MVKKGSNFLNFLQNDNKEKIKVDLLFEKAQEIADDPYLSILHKYKNKTYSDYIADKVLSPNPLLLYLEELNLDCSVIATVFRKRSVYDNFTDTKYYLRHYYLVADFQDSVLKGYWNYRVPFAEDLYISSNYLLEQFLMHEKDRKYDFKIITKAISELKIYSDRLEFLKKDFENRLKQKNSFEQATKAIFEKIILETSSKSNSKKGKSIPSRTQKFIIQEAGGVCSICEESDVATLEFHHIRGRDIQNPNNHENLIYICKNCHGKITAGQITQEKVLLYKEKLKMKPTRQNECTVQNIKISDINNYGIVAGNVKITNRGKKSIKMLPPQGTIGSEAVKRNYLKHLIDRYHEFAKAEKKNNFKYAVFYKSIEREYGAKWDMIPIHLFENVTDYVQQRIDSTVFGKNMKIKGNKRYSTFDEYCEKYIKDSEQ